MCQARSAGVLHNMVTGTHWSWPLAGCRPFDQDSWDLVGRVSRQVQSGRVCTSLAEWDCPRGPGPGSCECTAGFTGAEVLAGMSIDLFHWESGPQPWPRWLGGLVDLCV